MFEISIQGLLKLLVLVFFYDFFYNQNILKSLKDIVAIFEISNIYIVEALDYITRYRELSASIFTALFLSIKNIIQVS